MDDLFGPVPPPAPPEWQGLGGGPGGRNWAWLHAATGMVVRHCGHPTALRPYYITAPAGEGRVVLKSLGVHVHLATAQTVALEYARAHGVLP